MSLIEATSENGRIATFTLMIMITPNNRGKLKLFNLELASDSTFCVHFEVLKISTSIVREKFRFRELAKLRTWLSVHREFTSISRKNLKNWFDTDARSEKWWEEGAQLNGFSTGSAKVVFFKY